MNSTELEPPLREITIRPDLSRSLQQQLEEAIHNGVRRVILEGRFTRDFMNDFSLIQLKAHHHLEIIGGPGAILDGEGQVNHLIFLDNDARLTIKDLTLTGGSTESLATKHQAPSHRLQDLNIFRHLDGAAVSVGAGATFRAYDCHFLNNHSGLCGGAVSNLGGWADFHRCRFTGNRAVDTGSAIDNLGRGSLATVFECVFNHNPANSAGGGNHGAVTAFPETFLFMVGNNFLQELDPAVDYRLHHHKQPHSIVIGPDNQFRPGSFSIVEDPLSNSGITRLILRRFIQLHSRGRKVKWEGIPVAPPDIVEQHRQIFSDLVRQYKV